MHSPTAFRQLTIKKTNRSRSGKFDWLQPLSFYCELSRDWTKKTYPFALDQKLIMRSVLRGRALEKTGACDSSMQHYLKPTLFCVDIGHRGLDAEIHRYNCYYAHSTRGLLSELIVIVHLFGNWPTTEHFRNWCTPVGWT